MESIGMTTLTMSDFASTLAAHKMVSAMIKLKKAHTFF
ncbi:hypothetical protein C943_03625 [Mariniradius saccharolyticus AK6]|uniref:Uncharacterized protein n=1 Tax=Mariniradius saccharolyticus AK6 TaxID=1239962 RepID=M7YB63_9BACT|nr:hypothetical protein C943_03625 [Mariniradius saccharolyticus AK6]